MDESDEDYHYNRVRPRLVRGFSKPNDNLTVSADVVDELPKNIEFGYLDAFALVISIGSFIFDTVTDMLVAYFHHRDGNTWYFALTLTFIIIPTLTMTAFSLRWYIVDAKDPKTPKASKLQWALRVFFLLFQLGPVLRYVDAFMFGLKVKKNKEDKGMQRYTYLCMSYEDADAALLRLFESFLEAAPQLVLQLYIMAQPADLDNSRWTIIIQSVGVVGSLTSLAWSLIAQHRSMRLSMEEAKNLSWKGTVVMFLWRLFVIGARMIALGLFASRFPIHFACIMALRWGIMTLWIMSLKTEFCDSKYEEYLYNSVLGAIFLFCYFNPKNNETKWRYTLFYIYTFVENCILMGIWYGYKPLDVWYRFPAIVAHFLSFFMGLVFMALYYLLLHPSKSSKLLVDFNVSQENGNGTYHNKYKDNISNSSTIPEVGLFEPPVFGDLAENNAIGDGAKNKNAYLEIMAQIHDEKPIGTAV